MQSMAHNMSMSMGLQRMDMRERSIRERDQADAEGVSVPVPDTHFVRGVSVPRDGGVVIEYQSGVAGESDVEAVEREIRIERSASLGTEIVDGHFQQDMGGDRHYPVEVETPTPPAEVEVVDAAPLGHEDDTTTQTLSDETGIQLTIDSGDDTFINFQLVLISPEMGEDQQVIAFPFTFDCDTIEEVVTEMSTEFGFPVLLERRIRHEMTQQLTAHPSYKRYQSGSREASRYPEGEGEGDRSGSLPPGEGEAPSQVLPDVKEVVSAPEGDEGVPVSVSVAVETKADPAPEPVSVKDVAVADSATDTDADKASTGVGASSVKSVDRGTSSSPPIEIVERERQREREALREAEGQVERLAADLQSEPQGQGAAQGRDLEPPAAVDVYYSGLTATTPDSPSESSPSDSGDRPKPHPAGSISLQPPAHSSAHSSPEQPQRGSASARSSARQSEAGSPVLAADRRQGTALPTFSDPPHPKETSSHPSSTETAQTAPITGTKRSTSPPPVVGIVPNTTSSGLKSNLSSPRLCLSEPSSMLDAQLLHEISSFEHDALQQLATLDLKKKHGPQEDGHQAQGHHEFL
ncbi:hypothetical protein KIPB_003157 [Kipferlia bialata]|uniref:Uncharacterized protein n=2 Tax=Kipferlia bialata TaxID=797122 RepID=A0A391NJX5_9EUKA|nr:hypothetical protein KIPB_003157 [Kipferlia bialata]|eukprot:g3157.t1